MPLSQVIRQVFSDAELPVLCLHSQYVWRLVSILTINPSYVDSTSNKMLIRRIVETSPTLNAKKIRTTKVSSRKHQISATRRTQASSLFFGL